MVKVQALLQAASGASGSPSPPILTLCNVRMTSRNDVGALSGTGSSQVGEKTGRGTPHPGQLMARCGNGTPQMAQFIGHPWGKTAEYPLRPRYATRTRAEIGRAPAARRWAAAGAVPRQDLKRNPRDVRWRVGGTSFEFTRVPRPCDFVRKIRWKRGAHSLAGATVRVTVVSPLISKLDSPAQWPWLMSLATAMMV
jgi:hypothetical protein